MRKNIDIKKEDVQPLKILAVKANKDLKNYIQDVLSEHVLNAKKSLLLPVQYEPFFLCFLQYKNEKTK